MSNDKWRFGDRHETESLNGDSNGIVRPAPTSGQTSTHSHIKSKNGPSFTFSATTWVMPAPCIRFLIHSLRLDEPPVSLRFTDQPLSTLILHFSAVHRTSVHRLFTDHLFPKFADPPFPS